jgi:hypothetical protein
MVLMQKQFNFSLKMKKDKLFSYGFSLLTLLLIFLSSTCSENKVA